MKPPTCCSCRGSCASSRWLRARGSDIQNGVVGVAERDRHFRVVHAAHQDAHRKRAGSGHSRHPSTLRASLDDAGLDFGRRELLAVRFGGNRLVDVVLDLVRKGGWRRCREQQNPEQTQNLNVTSKRNPLVQDSITILPRGNRVENRPGLTVPTKGSESVDECSTECCC